MAGPRFRLLETTADMGFFSWGRSERELFENAAAGLARVLVVPGGVRSVEERAVTVRAADREGLLVAWLSEWLYLFDAEGFIGSLFKVEAAGGRRVSGVARGDLFDPARHTPGEGVKGVTYHRLEIVERRGRLRARVILDV